jgi:uncharacterized protein with HEPN domain
LRHDNMHLADMLLAAQRVADHLRGITETVFLTNRTIQAAVEREVSILGEAAGRLSTGFRTAHPDLPWRRLVQLRNFYVHAYERLDAREVWATATRFVPRIGRMVAALIPSEEEEAE